MECLTKKHYFGGLQLCDCGDILYTRVAICAILSVRMTNIESEIMECSSLSLEYSHHSPFLVTQLGRDGQKLESSTYHFQK